MVVGVSQQTAQPSQWQEHTTSGGHKGWINRTTGEFREQVARPGSRQPGQEEGQPKQAKQQAPAPPDARQRADAINRNATNGVAAWAIWKATPADQMPTVAAMMSPEARQAVHNEWQKAQGQPVSAKPVQQKPQVPAGPWTKGSPPPEIGKVYNAPTSAMNVDPTRFQYKLNVDSTTGVGAELKEIKAFNPDFAGVISVWKDPLDGKTWVVNGHHRFELAQRTSHPEMAVRYVQADSARKARAVGAIINIAEGRGTAIDAAKFMRDMGVSQDEMERRGVSFKGKLAEDAAVLVKLNDRIFQKVALGIIEPNKAVAVAKHLDNPQLQDQLFDILDEQEAKGKQPTMRVIEEMAREFSAAPVTQTVRRDLFGEIIDDHSTFVERNQLKAFVRSELSKEVNDFLLVSSKRRAKKLAGAGNVIDVDENRRIAEEADRIRNVYDTLVNRKGELADALNDAAVQYAAAKNKKERDNVQQQAVNAVKRAVFREAGIGEADAGGKGSGLFSIPEGDRVGGGQDQTEALDAERRDSEPPRLAEKRKGAWFAKLLLRAIPHADTFAEAVAAVDAAMALQPFPPESAKLSIDIFSRKAQAVLSKALKAARKISASARRELGEALDKETPQQVVEAVSDFVERYYARLASLLGPTQLASLLQGASEVVARIPYVAPFGTTGAPVPPSLGPDEAGKIVKRLAKLTAIEQAQEIQELPVEHQTYIREALAAGPPTAPPPFEVAVPVDDSGEAAQFVFVEEAVKELSGKNCLTREEYDALEAATRQKAMTVAGVVSQETLEKIRDALAENIAEGVDFRDFKAKILEQVEPDTFLSDAHMENVFRSNVQAAFSDGQMNVLQNPAIRNGFPYAGYYAIHDDRVRCNHLALEKLGIDGTNIYRIDDPVFRTFRPPWDYQDRCSWVAMTVRMAADKGCVEAQNWLSTGVEPSPPAFVPMPAFRPPASFQRALAGSPLSIRLSLEPLMSIQPGAPVTPTRNPSPKAYSGWGEVEEGTHYHEPKTGMSDAELAGLASKPAPNPPKLNGLEYGHISDAWETTGRLWPEMAAHVSEVRSFDPATYPKHQQAIKAHMNPFTGVLHVNQNHPLSPDTLWHELVHVSQVKEGRLTKGRNEMEPDEYNEIEREAHSRQAQSLPLIERLRSHLASPALSVASAALGMVGDEWHGPEAPGPGWAQAGVGPHGGKIWKHQGGEGQEHPDQKQDDIVQSYLNEMIQQTGMTKEQVMQSIARLQAKPKAQKQPAQAAADKPQGSPAGPTSPQGQAAMETFAKLDAARLARRDANAVSAAAGDVGKAVAALTKPDLDALMDWLLKTHGFSKGMSATKIREHIADYVNRMAVSYVQTQFSLEGGPMLGMVGDEWHGPEAPGPGWVQISVGPHGGKVWKQGGKAKQSDKKRTTKLDPGSSFPPDYWATIIGKHLDNAENALKVWRSIPEDQREEVKKLLSPKALHILQTASVKDKGDGQSIADKIKAYTGGDELVKRLASTGAKPAEAKKQLFVAVERLDKAGNAYMEAANAYLAVPLTDPSLKELGAKQEAALKVYREAQAVKVEAKRIFDAADAEAKAQVEAVLKAKKPTKIPGRKANDIEPDHGQRIDEATRFVGAITQEAALGNVYHFPLGEATLGSLLSRRSAYYEGPSPNNKIVTEPANPISTIVHEYGHYLENNLPGAKELAAEYIKHRCASEQPVNLKQLFPRHGYDESEQGRKDKFDYFGDLAYYVGKVYPTGDTELVSMGLEYLYRDAAGFAAAEPEYCKLMLGILHGELRHVGDHSV